MCDKCADIDYPIADSIWLPCGGPASRYTVKRRRDTGEDQYEAGRIIQELRDSNARLMKAIQAQRQELKQLRQLPAIPAPAKDWDGPDQP